MGPLASNDPHRIVKQTLRPFKGSDVEGSLLHRTNAPGDRQVKEGRRQRRRRDVVADGRDEVTKL
jgi:hypothetical protein